MERWNVKRGGLSCWVAFLSIVPSFHLSAQVSLHVSAGLRYSSPLVHDSIVTPFDLAPALAPALALSAMHRLDARWSAEVALDFCRSMLERRERTGATLDAGTLSTIAFTVGLRRELRQGLAARAALGGLHYGADREGVFRNGTGGLFPIAALALSYSPSVGTRHGVALEARYDLHQFITPALRAEGFADPRVVHRVALAVRVAAASWP